MTNQEKASDAPISSHVDDAARLREQEEIAVENYQGLTFKVIVVYLAICFAAFANTFNLLASGAFGTKIADTVGGSNETIWLVQCLSIVPSVFVSPVAQAAGYWGRKWFIVAFTAVGAVGSIIISRASSMGMVIGGEILSGIAFGVGPLMYAVVSEILPRRHRPGAQAGINIAPSPAAPVGLLGGGGPANTSDEGWRIIWYILTGILALSAVATAFCYNPLQRPLQHSLTTREKLRALDWAGYALLAVGITLFSVGLTWSHNPYTWSDAHILASFIIGVLFLIALAVHNTIFTKAGLFNHTLFSKDRNFAVSLICIFAEGMTYVAGNNYFVAEMGVLFVTDTFDAALRFSISFFALIVAAVTVSFITSRTKKIRAPMVSAFAFLVIFDVLMATVTESSNKATWGYAIFFGLGCGISLTTVVVAAQLSTPPSLIAVTSGLVLSVRSLGGSVALPIYGAIQNSQISQNLVPEVLKRVLPLGLKPQYVPQFVAALAASDQEALLQIPGITPAIIAAGSEGIRQAYIPAFRYTWVTAGCFAAVACIIACFFINPSGDFTMHVDAPLTEEPKSAKQTDTV